MLKSRNLIGQFKNQYKAYKSLNFLKQLLGSEDRIISTRPTKLRIFSSLSQAIFSLDGST